MTEPERRGWIFQSGERVIYALEREGGVVVTYEAGVAWPQCINVRSATEFANARRAPDPCEVLSSGEPFDARLTLPHTPNERLIWETLKHWTPR